MPQSLIIEKIKDAAPGQILSFHGFLKVQEEDSYSFYKTNQNNFLFVFRATNGDLKFMDTIEFRVMDKVGLFYFFSKRLEPEYLLESIRNMLRIESYDEFHFATGISEQRLKDSYFSLEKTDFLKGTQLEDYAYSRHGFDVLLYKDTNNKAVDLVSYLENDEDAYSEFGNNFGFHYIKKLYNTKLLLTYHPVFLLPRDNYEFSSIVTKYNFSLFDVMAVLRKEDFTEIFIPVTGHISYSYKLKALLKFFNFYNTKLRFEMLVSSNNFFVELSFLLHGTKSDKLEMLNIITSLENDMKKIFDDNVEGIKDSVANFFNFRIDVFSQGDIHSGKIVFRNNLTMISVVIERVKEMLHNMEKNNYKFV